MPNKTCKSLVREICVHGPELVALVQRHPQEANQLSLGIEIAPRPMRNVVGQDHLIIRLSGVTCLPKMFNKKLQKIRSGVTCLPKLVKKTGVPRLSAKKSCKKIGVG